MAILAVLRIALRALGRNRVRTFLTTLGVVIGVGSVIAMVSLGNGAQASVKREIESMGTNMLYLRPGSSKSFGMHSGAGSVQTLTPEDIEAIVREVPAVRLASPSVGTGVQVVFGNMNWSTRSEGVNEHFAEIRNWPLEKGAMFSDQDVRSAARVAVIGKTVEKNLFQGVDPVGQTIRVRNYPFLVVGVLSAKGENQWGRDQDDTLLLPYTTVQKKLLGITYLHGAMISAVSPEATFTAQEEITSLLRQRHRIGPDAEDDFTVRNQTDLADAAAATNRILTFLLGSIASVSLLVGGIGIMNIMLVSVTERTREIGIRMAIGAKPLAIQLQFLAEAVVLSLLGGAVGILLGLLLSWALARGLGWPVLVSPASIAASVIFAAVVGIGFGFYPAAKAARLDPIEALRYE